ncbi:Flp family type IVb pilin [Salinibacterium sp. SYSU T00001]|uniref:Flp family type IVb pilin n=1 Tax=Homoserinimonas sedimenticola TaxID=2986805 RepID=UPI0022360592|nr:Flp family type IVb pilin [Salinibacterium sedimenticola]MCW4385433.1 Flp family type IVb pilin [Salinibacterium sedimenticola]
MTKFLITLRQFIDDRLGRDERGASAVEYAILVGVIAVVVIAAVWIFGDELAAFFSNLLPDNLDDPTP